MKVLDECLDLRKLKDELPNSDAILSEMSFNYAEQELYDEGVARLMRLASIYCSEESVNYARTELLKAWKTKKEFKFMMEDITFVKDLERKCYSAFEFESFGDKHRFRVSAQFLNFHPY